MATFQRFEDIIAWQKARALNKEIYNLSNKSSFARDLGFNDQIRRSSVSILSNIAEGFERRSQVEFAQFLNFAKGSAGEFRAQLYIALDLQYIGKEDFDKLNQSVIEISKMITGLMDYLKPTTKTIKAKKTII